jgi:hypothetical protein
MVTGAVTAQTACADSSTGPVTELVIESVTPRPFAMGDVVEVRGPGVDRSDITVDGRPVRVVGRSRGGVRFEAPAVLPPCGSPLPLVQVTVVADGLRDSTLVATTGRPVDVELEVGEHRVVDDLAVGCDVSLRRAGTYGVALYRTASTAVQDDERVIRRAVTVRLHGGAAPAAGAMAPLGAPAAGPRPSSRPRRAVDVALPWEALTRAPAEATTCTREPSSPGDRITLDDPWREITIVYEVVSTSEHYAVQVQVDSLLVYDAHRRAIVEGLATAIEEEVHPYLERVFEAWPDSDGDGRLEVLFGEETAAVYPGGLGIRPDGCVGDFVLLGHGRADADIADILLTVVHEAMHWYDIGPDLTRQSRMQDWSIEAVATLTALWWRWGREGRSLEGNYGAECDPGTTCWRVFLEEDRYGAPGLTRSGGYGHGMYLTWYLVQQAADGADVLAALGHLRHRASGPRVLAVGPVFALAGGKGRSESDLQGEYLLSFYADDHVPGISRRIMQPSWDLPANWSHYPLRSFVLNAHDPEEDVALARPDGIVFEVGAGADAVLTFSPQWAGLAAALVRSR